MTMTNKKWRVNRQSWLGAAFRIVIAAGMGATSASAQVTAGTANDNQWHWDLSFPLWGVGMDGTLSFAGIPEQHVEASFNDIVKNLNFGLMGHVEARRNHWGLGTDLLYAALEVDMPTSGPILGQTNPRANVKELITEGFGFYRLVNTGSEADNQGYVDVVFGARDYGMQTQVKGNLASSSERSFDFADVLTGARGYAGLGKTWGARARADFAVGGSDLTWNLEGSLAWRASRRWTIDGGYRYMDIDYDKGRGSDRKIFKVKMFGPVITFRFVS